MRKESGRLAPSAPTRRARIQPRRGFAPVLADRSEPGVFSTKPRLRQGKDTVVPLDLQPPIADYATHTTHCLLTTIR
jgi:hypothetical protein